MRKICVITGSRAEYGLLYWVIKAIELEEEFGLQLLVTGMHLSKEFGLTYKEIEKDGFKIDKKINILNSSDLPVGISKSMGDGMIYFSKAFEELKPDLILILGDRFEIFSAASAAMIARIPIAHCHGGESTEGTIDESIRHSITKMSHIHFCSTDIYKRRILQLGENPKNIFNVGALGIENINKLTLLSKKKLEKSISFNFNGDLTFLVTFHPVTLENNSSENQVIQLLDAIDKFDNAKIIFTKSNSDTYGRIINYKIDEYVKKNPLKSISFFSLGQIKYLSCLNHIDCVIGNSSSGVIEVPSFKKPTINIGDRQKGRLMPKSVISCNPTTAEIENAIRIAISKDFKNKNLSKLNNPYENGNSSKKIINILKKISLKKILKKKFHDVI